MVSCASIVAVAVAVASFVSSSSSRILDPNKLAVGEFFRPSGHVVSGFFNTTASFRRSPCPALNVLANHGHLPRNGQGITKDQIGSALKSVLNQGDDAVVALLASLPDTIALSDLSQHNVWDHDASLVHTDAHFGHDPSEVNISLANDLFNRGKISNKLGVNEVGNAYKDRRQEGKSHEPKYSLSDAQKTQSYSQGAGLLLVFGAKNGESVSLDVARSFLIDERIPQGWKPAATPITVADSRATSAKIREVAEAM
ncbi:Peroxidase family protein 2 [Phytophthora infestans]|uniref:Peroxidase family protein 2 n=1 Tax=Phytophthora infestans TaxID=4787 RepID=A0A8S9UNR6_PHYIN|nr:Peroxidase family protein 2 [Phytophthora infestans]